MTTLSTQGLSTPAQQKQTYGITYKNLPLEVPGPHRSPECPDELEKRADPRHSKQQGEDTSRVAEYLTIQV